MQLLIWDRKKICSKPKYTFNTFIPSSLFMEYICIDKRDEKDLEDLDLT